MAALMSAGSSASRWIAAIRFFQLGGVVGVGAQVDPGLQCQDTFGLVVDARQQDLDDREVVLAGLAVEGDLNLTVLPGAHPLAEEHRDRAGTAELFFEKRLPGLAGRQSGPIEEAVDAGFAQTRAHGGDRIRIGSAVPRETSLAVAATMASHYKSFRGNLRSCRLSI
jgi:hypothetical protein